MAIDGEAEWEEDESVYFPGMGGGVTTSTAYFPGRGGGRGDSKGRGVELGGLGGLGGRAGGWGVVSGRSGRGSFGGIEGPVPDHRCWALLCGTEG